MGIFFRRKCTSKARLDGKTAIITGCNTGIGKQTALDFYKRGEDRFTPYVVTSSTNTTASIFDEEDEHIFKKPNPPRRLIARPEEAVAPGARLIMACRNIQKAETARDWIKDACKDQKGLGELVVMDLDVSSLRSVRLFAEQILQTEQYVHLLVNNAGIMMCPRALSEDGFELQFATNHLGHFLLTLLLLPKILLSVPARIVNVSSVAHTFCTSMYFDDINMEKSYNSLLSYARSKVSNVLFSKELANRLKGTGVTVYSLHPGVVDTELTRHFSSTILPGVTWFVQNIGKYFILSPQQGAETSIYCSVDEKTAKETGLYYDNCKAVTPSAKAQDPELAKKLWDVSIELVKLGSYDPFKQNILDAIS